jgi:NADH dehydrogenase FAD-containing subunit
MESKAVPGIHVLGDATLSAPAMPKSASMANNHAKVAAAAVVELLNGRTPSPVQIINTCYSFVSQKEAMRVSSVHAWTRRTAPEGAARRRRLGARSEPKAATPGAGPQHLG